MANIYGTSIGNINNPSGDDQTAATNGTSSADTIYLYSGDDQTRPGDGADTIFGGAGTDRVSYFDATGAIALSLSAGVGTLGFAAGDTYDGIEDVFGSQFSDTISGDGGNNSLNGFLGNDTIYAGAGQDTVVGGDGADQLFGSVGNDSVYGGEGNDRLYGGENNDIILGAEGADSLYGGSGDDALSGGAGADSFDGGDGDDVLSYFDNSVAVTVNLATNSASGGDATGDTFVNIEGIEGSDHADRLTGDGASNFLFGGAGADVLDGGAGADTMQGGLGNDFYIVDNAGDVVTGEVGFSVGGGIDTVRAFVDYVQPTNVELVRLGNITDTTNLSVTGNSAPGTLVGNAGNNTMTGGFSNNQINGNNGNDTLEGRNGQDTLVGGSGSDTFVYNVVSDSDAGTTQRDVINGFSNGFDIIDLSAVDANSNTGGDDAFVFIGSASFSGTAGELRTQGLGGANALIVEADVDGDGAADMQIFVNLTTTMSTSDFIL